MISVTKDRTENNETMSRDFKHKDQMRLKQWEEKQFSGRFCQLSFTETVNINSLNLYVMLSSMQ